MTARQRRIAVVGLGLAVLALGQHAALLSDQYQLGQLNDDGLYVSLARSLAHGQGFVDASVSGHPPETFVPPGFPAFLVPGTWWGGTTLLRLEVFAAMAAVLPLTWVWVRRRSGSSVLAAGVVGVLVGSPLIANYSELVMAEGPYLAALMGGLLALHHWEQSLQTAPRSAIACLGLLTLAVYVKSAGLAVLIGLVLWWALRRQWRRLWLSLGFFTAALLPLVISRLAAGVSVLGSDYGTQLGSYYHEGILKRLSESIPRGLHDYLWSAIPNTLFGTGSTLFEHGAWHVVGDVIIFATAPVIVLGFIAWHRRRTLRDATLVIVPVYLAETLAYLHVNERRAILVAPLLALWWIVGLGVVARAAGRMVTAMMTTGPLLPTRLVRTTSAVAGSVLLLLALVSVGSHSTTDYRGPSGIDLSAGAPWRTLIAKSRGVAASYYAFSTFALTGRVQAPAAFDACTDPDADPTDPDLRAAVTGRLTADGVTDVLLAPWAGPGPSPCMEAVLQATPGAIRIYDDTDAAISVWHLLPSDEHDALVGKAAASHGSSVEWTLRGCAGSQVFIDRATGEGDGGVTVSVRDRVGNWHDVATLPGGVVPGTRSGPGVPYWSRVLSGGIVTGVRLTWTGSSDLTVGDVHLICPGAP